MTDWIEWAGGQNPVPGKRVDVRFENDTVVDNEPSEWWDWTWGHSRHHVIAYRVIDDQ